MSKFSFRREKGKEFKHIAPGLIPAASIAPKPAVPRTPPPHSPNPSPERPRSALAAAILSSSLTGQTWALPPARPRSYSETDRSGSFVSEPNPNRDRWSEDLASRPCLSSPDCSEDELEDQEEDMENGDAGDHVYQTLDRGDTCSIKEHVYALPLKAKIRMSSATEMSGRGVPSPDVTEAPSFQSPEVGCDCSKKKASIRESSGSQRDGLSTVPAFPTTVTPSQPKNLEYPTQTSLGPREAHSEVQRKTVRSPKKTRMAGIQAELQNLRQHAQALVDENDALKLTVHRLNVELSCSQTPFRPLSKQELDTKYLSPLLLSYENKIKEKDSLLQSTQEELKTLHVHIEEMVKENKRLHDEIAKVSGVSQKDCHQLQKQAILVLKENQVLTDQLEAQHVRAKANQSKHHSEVSKVSKQLLLLEAENQHLQEDLEARRREVHKYMRDVQALQARLKDAVTWDEHCDITGKLKGQLEQQEKRSKSELDQLLLRASSLQEENRSLALDKLNLTADLKRMEAKLELSRQANRKAERKMSVLKLQRNECVLKEENIRHYLGAVISVAEHISQERDQLLNMASVLQREKQGFLSRILQGTVRFGKLQEEIKVYRRQASTKLAALEEAAEGRTASCQREILHLQRLLRERQEAEERLLQSKREVEEELEVVWQVATRENRDMKETLLDSRATADLHGGSVSGSGSPGWLSPASDEKILSTKHQPHSSGLPLFTSHQHPGLQRRTK
ncbi:centrosomal protein of 89 kDa isoform X2 [Echeneis naucrates]|uniref:centrosomal protein of 89 kDa isoform X2 n=1 Tax=Echeneis naucrates TaxID=173247 RepID=UPI00111335FA|nr:centrosomal protein of 89 kDa isoform X2 [Echeneis naucrates]